MQLEMNFKTTTIRHRKYDMTESVNTSIARSANITKPYAIKTKTCLNINQNLLLKQKASQSFGILQYIHTEKLTAINLILQLMIIKTTPINTG